MESLTMRESLVDVDLGKYGRASFAREDFECVKKKPGTSVVFGDISLAYSKASKGFVFSVSNVPKVWRILAWDVDESQSNAIVPLYASRK
jgi:hypothetical protein